MEPEAMREHSRRHRGRVLRRCHCTMLLFVSFTAVVLLTTAVTTAAAKAEELAIPNANNEDSNVDMTASPGVVAGEASPPASDDPKHELGSADAEEEGSAATASSWDAVTQGVNVDIDGGTEGAEVLLSFQTSPGDGAKTTDTLLSEPSSIGDDDGDSKSGDSAVAGQLSLSADEIAELLLLEPSPVEKPKAATEEQEAATWFARPSSSENDDGNNTVDDSQHDHDGDDKALSTDDGGVRSESESEGVAAVARATGPGASAETTMQHNHKDDVDHGLDIDSAAARSDKGKGGGEGGRRGKKQEDEGGRSEVASLARVKEGEEPNNQATLEEASRRDSLDNQLAENQAKGGSTIGGSYQGSHQQEQQGTEVQPLQVHEQQTVGEVVPTEILGAEEEIDVVVNDDQHLRADHDVEIASRPEIRLSDQEDFVRLAVSERIAASAPGETTDDAASSTLRHREPDVNDSNGGTLTTKQQGVDDENDKHNTNSDGMNVQQHTTARVDDDAAAVATAVEQAEQNEPQTRPAGVAGGNMSNVPDGPAARYPRVQGPRVEGQGRSADGTPKAGASIPDGAMGSAGDSGHHGRRWGGVRADRGGGGGDNGGKSGGGRGGDTEEVPSLTSPEDLAKRVREMETELLRKLLAEEDAKSLLDIWVENAREFILTRTVPPTDAECDYNWSRLRCEPKCACGARLRFGDYTPGRSCRLLRPWERSDDCADAWDPSDEPAVKRFVAATAGVLGAARRSYEARVAPPSDEECTFSFESRRCEPQALCRLSFRWGDLTMSRACRLAKQEDIFIR